MTSTLANLRAQLNFFLQTMVVEGLVNNEFLQLQSLKETVRRDIVIRTIVSYWSRATKHLFPQMSKQLDMAVVDFHDINVCTQDLLERSNSIGAVQVSIACTDILNSCHDQDINCCKEALTRAKREFTRLQVKFESVVELERNIIECEEIQDRRVYGWRQTHICINVSDESVLKPRASELSDAECTSQNCKETYYEINKNHMKPELSS